MGAPSQRGAVAIDQLPAGLGATRGLHPVRIFKNPDKDGDICIAFTDGHKNMVLGYEGDQFYVMVDGNRVFETGAVRAILSGAGFDGWEVTPHLEPLANASFSIGDYDALIENFYISGSVKGAREVNLTSGVATQVAAIIIPEGERVSGRLHYSIYASDGVELQHFASSIPFVAVNKGGVISRAMVPAAPDQSNDGNAGVVTAGTFAYAVTTTVTATELRFHINAVSSLTETALNAAVKFFPMMRAQVTDPL